MSNDDDNNNNVLKYDINTMSAEAAEKKTISNGLSSAKTIGPRRRTRLPARRQRSTSERRLAPSSARET